MLCGVCHLIKPKLRKRKLNKTLKTSEIKITQMSDRLNRIYEQLGTND